MQKLYLIIKNGFNNIVDLIYPVYCINCNKVGVYLCEYCISTLTINKRESVNEIYSLYEYNNNLVKRIIWSLKYHHSSYLGRVIGDLMFNSYMEELSNILLFSKGEPVIVIPVPILKSKYINRGYNQSEIISKHFCNNLSKNELLLENKLIYKSKKTAPQAHIKNKFERLENIKDSFGINNSVKIRNRIFIIIDDVYTTGGTIFEIKKLLLKNGASKVYAFTLAH